MTTKEYIRIDTNAIQGQHESNNLLRPMIVSGFTPIKVCLLAFLYQILGDLTE